MDFKKRISSLGVASMISLSNASFAQGLDVKNIQSEIGKTLMDDGKGKYNLTNDDTIEVQQYIDARIVTDAALDYFDEEVRLYTLKGETRAKVDSILVNYLSVHPLLYVGDDNKLIFEIDDKSEFSKMIKDIANALFGGMSKFIRGIAVTFVFGGEENLQYQLDNLGESIFNMKLRLYKDMVFDYVGGIVKRVVLKMGGNLTIGEYYNFVKKYFPNKFSDKIERELKENNWYDVDIKQMRYPFKK